MFDLDNTLFDTRPRTVAIAHAFDVANNSCHFAGITVGHVAQQGRSQAGDTARLAGANLAYALRFQVLFLFHSFLYYMPLHI